MADTIEPPFRTGDSVRIVASGYVKRVQRIVRVCAGDQTVDWIVTLQPGFMICLADELELVLIADRRAYG